jgi:hypothetical protein
MAPSLGVDVMPISVRRPHRAAEGRRFIALHADPSSPVNVVERSLRRNRAAHSSVAELKDPNLDRFGCDPKLFVHTRERASPDKPRTARDRRNLGGVKISPLFSLVGFYF